MSLILSGTDGLSDVDGSAATPAIRGTDANTGIFFPAADTIGFAEGGAEAMRIDSSGNVGVGTASPSGYKLAVGDGSSNRGRIMLKGATSGNYPEINIDDSMNTSGKNYQLYSTGGVLKVANQTDSGAVSFVSNAFGIGLGDNAAVDGTGIRFPATQSASTNANTLDDYEEGTFSPTITGSSSGSATYAAQNGLYVKVGGWVFIQLYVGFSKNTISGNVILGNLPFTAKSGSNYYYSTSCGYWNNLATAILNPTSYLGGGNSLFTLRKLTAASTNTNAALTDADLGASGNEFMFSVFYPVN